MISFKRKINKAYCPEKIIHDNPIIEYCKHIIFEKFKTLKVERPAKFGGDLEFKSYDELLKSLLLDYIDRQIILYEEHAKAFEAKHGMTFEEYTRSLRGRASIAEEDEWMDWEEALVFLGKWRKIKRQIGVKE